MHTSTLANPIKETEMAQFNIDSHLSDGKSLQWLALPDAGV